MEGLHVYWRVGGPAVGKVVSRAAQQQLAPLAKLVWMDVRALHQLGEHGVALLGRQRDLDLESRRVIATGTTCLAHLA